MTTGSAHNTADGVDVQALIEEGLAATGILPTYERLVELDAQLRTAIAELMPAARAATSRLNRGTCAWWSRQSAIDNANRALSGDMGAGLRSAAMHVAELARCCHGLKES